MRDVQPPAVVLGERLPEGIAPTVYVLVERGVARNPRLARRTQGLVELRFEEGYPPVRLEFRGESVLVADGALEAPDLAVSGRLPDIVQLTAAPLVAGVPKPTRRHGRSALAVLATGRVRISGRRALGRQLLALLSIEA